MAGGDASRERLRRLGIDVWVRRSERSAAEDEAPPAAAAPRPASPPSPAPMTDPAPPGAHPAPPGAHPAPPGAHPAPSGAHPAPPGAPGGEAFSIHCFRLGRVFVAADDGAWRRRRFLLDVARAMNGFAAAERTSMRFDWPQPGVSASSSAERAFAAFLDGQTAPGTCRLIAGGRAAALAGLDAGDSRAVPGGLYLNPADESGEAKKALWALIAAMADD